MDNYFIILSEEDGFSQIAGGKGYYTDYRIRWIETGEEEEIRIWKNSEDNIDNYGRRLNVVTQWMIDNWHLTSEDLFVGFSNVTPGDFADPKTGRLFFLDDTGKIHPHLLKVDPDDTWDWSEEDPKHEYGY